MRRHVLGQCPVVEVAVADRGRSVDVVEPGERVRGEYLVADAGRVHAVDAHRGVHERRSAVVDTLESPVGGAKHRGAAGPLDLGAVRARRTERRLEHDVGVEVDEPVGDRPGHANTTGYRPK